MSELQGGKFGHGFASAGVTQAFSPLVGTIDQHNIGVSIPRIFVASVVAGTASELSGGKFANGAKSAAFLTAFRDLPGQYEEWVGYELDHRPGGEVVQKGPFTPPIKGANNFGTQGQDIDDPCFSCEGSTLSLVMNQVPSMNAIAGLHDMMQIQMGDGFWRGFMNIPNMPPAAAFVYAALVGQALNVFSYQQVTQLSVALGQDNEKAKRRQLLAINQHGN